MYKDGTSPRNRTNNSANDKEPSLSAGHLLAFSSDRNALEENGGGYDIYLLNFSSRRVTRLTSDSADDELPTINSAGDRVAFVSDRDGNAEVYVQALSGGNVPDGTPVNISGNAKADMDPAWSPDGCRIAFASDRDGDWDIYIANADGTNPLNLTDGEEDDEHDYNERWPDLAIHDGKERVIFASDRTADWEIYSIYTDGTLLLRATTNLRKDAVPAWGPSGRRLRLRNV